MINSKYISLTFTILVLTICLSAQQPESKSGMKNISPLKLSSQADTIQYSLGAYVGQWLLKSGFVINNKVLFQRGIDDVLQNKKLAIADTIIAPMVASYQLSLQNAKSRAMEDQLFAALKGKPGVGALPNGVHYIIIKSGTGVRPLAQDTIVINATGIFPDGTVFEDTFKKKKPITSLTGNLIPGLSEAIQLMPEGSVWRIFIPSVLAYGPAGLTNVIPPNTALVFDITLLEIKKQ